MCFFGFGGVEAHFAEAVNERGKGFVEFFGFGVFNAHDVCPLGSDGKCFGAEVGVVHCVIVDIAEHVGHEFDQGDVFFGDSAVVGDACLEDEGGASATFGCCGDYSDGFFCYEFFEVAAGGVDVKVEFFGDIDRAGTVREGL